MAEDRIVATACLNCGNSEFTLPRGFRWDDETTGEPYCARCTEGLSRDQLRSALLVAASVEAKNDLTRRRH